MHFESYLDYNDTLPSSSRIRYEVEKESFYFLSEDSEGFEIELSTSVELVWKIRKGTYSSQAETPDEYFDSWELTAHHVGATVDFNSGEKIDPKKVLAEDEYKRYNRQLEEFVSKYE